MKFSVLFLPFYFIYYYILGIIWILRLADVLLHSMSMLSFSLSLSPHLNHIL